MWVGPEKCKLRVVCMSTYFFVIFELHHTVSKYNVCLEEYMDLLVRLRSGTTFEDTKSMRSMKNTWIY